MERGLSMMPPSLARTATIATARRLSSQVLSDSIAALLPGRRGSLSAREALGFLAFDFDSLAELDAEGVAATLHRVKSIETRKLPPGKRSFFAEINRLSACDVFGEVGVVRNCVRSCSVIATEKTELLVIPRYCWKRNADKETKQRFAALSEKHLTDKEIICSIKESERWQHFKSALSVSMTRGTQLGTRRAEVIPKYDTMPVDPLARASPERPEPPPRTATGQEWSFPPESAAQEVEEPMDAEEEQILKDIDAIIASDVPARVRQLSLG